jgi:predicted nucleic acid-binding protein
MSKLFIDTGAFLARELTHDQHHFAAADGWNTLAESADRLFSTEHVLDETITLLARGS